MKTEDRILVGGFIVALILAGLRMFGLTAAELGEIGAGKFRRAAVDAKAVMSGEYVQRTAERLRSEAAALPPMVPAAHDNEDPRLQRDLMAERKRYLEERADFLQKNGVKIMKGDVETLKKQVEEQVRQAGGNY